MIAAIFLLLVVVVWRVALGVTHSEDFGWLHNFAPLSAIALCGAIFLPRRLAFALPLSALFLSDLALNAHYGVALISTEMLARYGALAVICAGGWMLRGNANTALVLGSSLMASAVFFVVTNTASWITDPGYMKTLGDWSRAMTTGIPGFPPTLVFFRNTLLSDLFFTALFLACLALQRSPSEAPATTPSVQEPAPW